MGSRTLSRYFAGRFFVSVVAVFAGVFVLVLFVDYIDLMRRASDAPKAQASMLVLVSFFRVPQIMERLFPFSVLIGAMTCFFSLSRRMELVIARGAGISVWQIIAPALLVALALGAFGSLVYNPVSANLREISKRIESQIFGQFQSVMDSYDSGYWVRQRGNDGESIMNALQSREQGLVLNSIIACSFSLRAFRFGGVPQRILLGVAAGFSIYVLSKVTEDLSKAELLYPLLAAWLPIIAGGLFGFLILLYEEDG